ncbi:ABC transporter substrate-binding protein [Microbacterium sp. LRZ72]|uniref:ABC transporter substrate-binding protein n=1 Tax=Microbacterium sp. LRZ72 TaxID=2942481 RepID=UPI0029AB6ED0|nr:ABC transporter substrate-binding protein [Microbacterium sp. LRZ72]MDX2377332.1 ABC transporter substrate-binding protein [Microbacterium sp. LRZ72]
MMIRTTAHHPHRLIVATGVGAALVLAGCAADPEGGGGGDTGDGGDGGTIRVAYLATGSALPLFVAAEKYADEVGIDVEMIEVASGNESITGVATGQYDAGFAGIGSAAYNAVDEGLPVQYVAPMHSGYVEDYFILSSELAGSEEEAAAVAEDMTALEGETFAANAPGVVTEALLGFALERGGLTMDQVALEYIPFPDQVPALANGGIAGGILSEPFPTQAEQNGSGYRPWATPTDEPPLPFTGIIYNTDWAEENSQLAEDYMRAYAMGAEDLEQNGWDTDEMLSLVEEYTGADPEIIAAARQHHISSDLSVDFDVLLRYQEFFMEQGSLNYDEIIPEEEIWNFSWRDAALEN